MAGVGLLLCIILAPGRPKGTRYLGSKLPVTIDLLERINSSSNTRARSAVLLFGAGDLGISMWVTNVRTVVTHIVCGSTVLTLS